MHATTRTHHTSPLLVLAVGVVACATAGACTRDDNDTPNNGTAHSTVSIDKPLRMGENYTKANCLTDLLQRAVDSGQLTTDDQDSVLKAHELGLVEGECTH